MGRRHPELGVGAGVTGTQRQVVQVGGGAGVHLD